MTEMKIDFTNSPFLYYSEIENIPDRLNWKCEILLTRNQEVIKDKRVLDIASHNGTFSFACLKLGASHVTGVEIAPDLVESSIKNLNKLGSESSKFKFVCNDVFEELRKFEVGQFVIQLIICFGFFYYGMRQAELLSEIERLKPKTLILDTLIAQVPRLLKVAKFLRKTGLLRLIEHQRLDCKDFKSYKKQLGNEPISHIDQLLDEKYLVYIDYFSDNEKILPFEYHRFYATDKVV
jgi:hypothetical protein